MNTKKLTWGILLVIALVSFVFLLLTQANDPGWKCIYSDPHGNFGCVDDGSSRYCTELLDSPQPRVLLSELPSRSHLRVEWCPNADCDMSGDIAGNRIRIQILYDPASGLSPQRYFLNCDPDSSVFDRVLKSPYQIWINDWGYTGFNNSCDNTIHNNSYVRWRVCNARTFRWPW